MIKRSIPPRIVLLCTVTILVVDGPSRVIAQAGLPTTSRPWFGNEYQRVAQAIESGQLKLPRYDDEKGAAILRRLTSIENLAVFRNKSLGLAPRMENYLAMSQATALILKQYVNALSKKQQVQSEADNIFCFMLQIAKVAIELTDEFIPSIPKDEQYPVRMQGLQQMRMGVTTQVVGAEQTLTEKGQHKDADRSLLLATLDATLPTLRQAVPPGYRKELRERLKIDRNEIAGREDRRHLDRMIALLAEEPRPAGP